MAVKISRLLSSCSSLVNLKSFAVTNRGHTLVIDTVFQRPFSRLFPFQRFRMASTDSTSASPVLNTEPVQNAEPIELESSTTSNKTEVALEDASTKKETPSNPAGQDATSDPSANLEEPKRIPRVPKIKAAVLLSYSGQGYFGMQMQNSGARTIENDLLKAFYDAKVIDDEGFQKPKSIKFQRAARTDKNVSAARNIISIMLPKTFDPDDVNKFLPDQIRIMDFRRVTKGFDAKLACNSRTYLYMIPTFAFTPFEQKVREDYRITPEVLAQVRRVLKLYEGTKNHHNFTSRKKPTDPSAFRYIMSFESSDPFEKDGLEYVVLKVKGQSFMLHQIRKMIGLVVAILRGFANEDTMEQAFKIDKVDIPMVPGLGLMLGEAHYDQYNKKFGRDGIHEPLIWDNVADRIEQFCQDKIYCNVTKTENEEKSMFQWLSTVPYHTFDSRDIDDPKGYGPLGKAHLRARRERGEDTEEQDEDEESEEDEEVERKKQRCS